MWASRAARRIFWTRNTLRRTEDRIEAWLTVLLLVVTLFVAPATGWWAAQASHRSDERANAWERQHRFPVDAVLLNDGSEWHRGGGGEGVPPPPPALTPARWTNRDGTIGTGMILAGVKQRSGTTVRIWVDDHGTVVTRPAQRNVTLNAIMVALLAMGGVTAGLWGARRIVIWRLNRRRLRAWQDDWRVVGPRWSHR